MIYMMTREQLADWLKLQNVESLKASTGLSTKTLYRIRSGGKPPSFDTLQKLLKAGAKPVKPAKAES